MNLMSEESGRCFFHSDRRPNLTMGRNYSEGAYWGEPNKFKFLSSIDSFEDATEMDDNERIIKTNFNMSFKGYLIPEAFNEFMNTQRFFSPKQVVVNDESGLIAQHCSQIVSPNFVILYGLLDVLLHPVSYIYSCIHLK